MAVKAKYGGTCAPCGRPYPAGASIASIDEKSWGHAACAQALRAKGQILAGETFRSRRPSDWRRGSTPSSSRTRP